MDDQDAVLGGRPCEFQLANGWAVQEPATAEAWWSPAAGLPAVMCIGHTNMFGTCSSLPAYVPHQSCLGQQLVEYSYAAPAQPNWPVAEVPTFDVPNSQVVVDLQNEETHTKVSNDRRVSGVFEQVSREFDADMEMIKQRMHRYPARLLGALHESYTVPRLVAIGPYHHHQDHLKQAEKVKHMAAIRCVVESGHLLEVVYSAVVSAANDVRRLGLYDKEVMKGIGHDQFQHMMFFDACFLVQYMGTRITRHESLRDFFDHNARDIDNDIILLENQLPWNVVEVVLEFMPEVRLGRFIGRWRGYAQHHKKPIQEEDDSHVSALIEDKRFKPHLLGLLRYYTVGRSSKDDTNSPNQQMPKNLSISISAIELAKIGIWLTSNKTMKLSDMGLIQEGSLFAKLSLAPLSLDRNRASYLLNMAALELCTVRRFGRAQVEDSAVCSYLQLLGLLVTRVEDVQELRARGLLQGGGGLTDEQAFRFLTSFQGLRLGTRYCRIMAQIKIYKENRTVGNKLYAFLCNNKRTIAAVFGVVVALFGIIGTLVSIKKAIS